MILSHALLLDLLTALPLKIFFVLSIKSTTYSIENIDFPAGTQYGLTMQGLKCFISFLQYYLVLKENCNLIISVGEPVLFSLPLGSNSWVLPALAPFK